MEVKQAFPRASARGALYETASLPIFTGGILASILVQLKTHIAHGKWFRESSLLLNSL